MIKYKIKQTNTKILLKVGDYSTDNCDIIINWINPNIIDSPPCFSQLIKNAGDQLYYNLLSLKNEIKSGDTFTTHAGLLSATIAINCVMPLTKSMYNDCFFRIKETIVKYHDVDNLCRFVTTTIPDINYKEFVHFLNTYILEMPFVKEYRLIVNNEKIYNSLKLELEKYYKEEKPFLNKVQKYFKKK